MTFNIVTITFLVGLALIVTAIFGGGLEVKEVKIPSMGLSNRVLSFAVGALLTGLCVFYPDPLTNISGSGPKITSQPPLETAAPAAPDASLGKPAPTTPHASLATPSPTTPPPSDKSVSASKGDAAVTATIVFRNSVGVDQISEDVEVVLDGEPSRTLSVDQTTKFRTFAYRTARKQIFYVLSGKQVMKTSAGEKEYTIEGYGTLDVANGLVLNLRRLTYFEDEGRVTIGFRQQSR
jgi:hypothetical protein